jgi:ABC-type bacteriocin/lantibiotic exporter with double-glycine peptidase domain
MKKTLQRCLWNPAQLPDALYEVARATGMSSSAAAPPESTRDAQVISNFEDWLDTAAARLGLEADSASLSFGNAQALFKEVAPALVQCSDSQKAGFLVLLRKRWRKILLLKPDGSTDSISVRELEELLFEDQRESVRPELETLLDFANIETSHRSRTFEALLKERVKDKWVRRVWRLRPNPGSNFWGQVRQAGAIPFLSAFFISQAATYGVLLALWAVLGKAVFAQTTNGGTIWLLLGLILILAILRPVAPWLYGALSLRMSERLKQRLLYGTLRLEPDEVRDQGTGQFLGRVIESEAIETSAMRGSGNIFMGLIQLLVTVPYLVFGAGGWLHVVLLCAWLGLSLEIGRRYFRARTAWTRTRLTLTHDLVEQMLGYRTRLVQQPRQEWHLQEERLLNEYDRLSIGMDRRNAWLKAVMPYGWTLVGLLALVPALLTAPTGLAALALGISGVVFASLSFQMIAEGLTQLSDAWIAWDQVKLMFDAAGRPSQWKAMAGTSASNGSSILLTANDLTFQYNRRPELVLNDCEFSIQAGERILLVGESGSGKSTLAAVLSGLRSPQKGDLILGGSTANELGERAWRKRIVAAPQFHENHIFAESFAFNLLLGRGWPPSLEDLQQAREICNALGLDRLLEDMPGGMFQFVGETGWQLSHGEKSRVYIARALLQGADIIILDESFSALDAGNLKQSMECVVEHAPTLVVVAHP